MKGSSDRETCPVCETVIPSSGTCPKCLSEAKELTTIAMDAGGGLPGTVSLRSPDIIGPYRLVSPLGEGGMGRVYVAEQSEPIRRTVALKIVKPGMDNAEVLARFEAERQALALMDHANIARVFDAGATDDGRPYFAMELVEGEPITVHCNRKKLGLRERLDLFMQVCHGVQHAHQKGVIHRDLKPSNILVTTAAEGNAVPKIIDFGVAKALGAGLTDRTLQTLAGQVLGTPQYMSPEQASLDGADIDTRSDIYSLGVLLFELLTGQTPLELARLRHAGMEAVLRTIREAEAPRPSKKLEELEDETRTAVARERSLPWPRLSQQLRGDLDWIVMKALEKERGRRYETATAFAEDVGRYLSNQPVSAMPPSAAYLFRKFARRHRVGLGAGSAVALAAVAGLAASLWQSHEAQKARGEAENHLFAASRSLHSEAIQKRDEGRINEAIAKAGRAVELRPDNRAAASFLAGILPRGTGQFTENAFEGHRTKVFGLAFSPDGSRLASWGWEIDHQWGEPPARIWDLGAEPTGRILDPGDLSFRLTAAAGFNRDGSRVFTMPRGSGAAGDGYWNATDGKLLANGLLTFPPEDFARYPADLVPKLLFDRREVLREDGATADSADLSKPLWSFFPPLISHDGGLIARLDKDEWSVQETKTLDPVWRMPAMSQEQPVFAGFSPDSQELIHVSVTQIRVMDAGTGKLRWEIPLQGTRDLFPAAKPDWKVQSAVVRRDWKGGRPLVLYAEIDGPTPVFAGWNLRTGIRTGLIRPETPGEFLLPESGDSVIWKSRAGSTEIWDLSSWEKKITLGVAGIPGSTPGGGMRVSPDGLRILAQLRTFFGTHELHLISLENGQSLRRFPKAGSWNAVFSPDGTRVVAYAGETGWELVDASDGETICRFTGHSAPITRLVFSPDGTRVASASEDRTVRVYRAQAPPADPLLLFDGPVPGRPKPDGAKQHSYREPFTEVRRNGLRLRTSYFGGSELISEDSPGKATVRVSQLGLGEWGRHRVFYGRIGHRGELFASVVGDATKGINCKIWDARTGAELFQLIPGRLEGVWRPYPILDFTLDGSGLAFQDHSDYFWQLPVASGTAPVPGWVVQHLVPLASGYRSDSNGQPVSLTGDEIRIARSGVREGLESSDAADRSDDPFLRCAYWILADPATRSMSPYGGLTADDWVAKAWISDRPEEIRDVLFRTPSNPLVFLALADVVESEHQAHVLRSHALRLLESAFAAGIPERGMLLEWAELALNRLTEGGHPDDAGRLRGMMDRAGFPDPGEKQGSPQANPGLQRFEWTVEPPEEGETPAVRVPKTAVRGGDGTWKITLGSTGKVSEYHEEKVIGMGNYRTLVLRSKGYAYAVPLGKSRMLLRKVGEKPWQFEGWLDHQEFRNPGKQGGATEGK